MRMKCLHATLAIVLAISNPQWLVSSVHAEDNTAAKKPPVILPEPGQVTAGDTTVKISVEAVPPASGASAWERILTGNAAITVYLTVGLYLLKWASDRYKLDLERWEGIIIHCYNDAEQSGLLKNWAGHEKLAHAMQLFDDRFRSAFGVDPTARDREDARLDFARTAFNDTSDDSSTPAAAAAPQALAKAG